MLRKNIKVLIFLDWALSILAFLFFLASVLIGFGIDASIQQKLIAMAVFFIVLLLPSIILILNAIFLSEENEIKNNSTDI